MKRRLHALLLAICCTSICCEAAAAMNPGIGRIPIAPVPYEQPNPLYPHRLEIRPTPPANLIIPSVIFRPPSEVLRHFDELRAVRPPDPVPMDAANAPAFVPGAPVPTVKTSREMSTIDPAAAQEPRTTRRQALGW